VGKKQDGNIEITISNRTDTAISNEHLQLDSPYFISKEKIVTIPSNRSQKISMALVWKEGKTLDLKQSCFDYKVTFHNLSIERAIPNYGVWKLIGPFIKDDPDLAPMHEKYPDHGLASLPSFNYMNRDKLNLNEEFVDIDSIRTWQSNGKLVDQPFDVQTIFPEGFKLNLNNYYIGRGERTIYLYTKLQAKIATEKWLMIGCSAYFRIFHNENKIYQADQIIRSWPYAHFMKLDIEAGENHLLVRIDTPTDNFDFEIGLKEFIAKHPHQSEWETEMVFNSEN
ncbi:MAG: hypothetical protein AAGI07_16970, partial [Bacteroidota bacterium]